MTIKCGGPLDRSSGFPLSLTIGRRLLHPAVRPTVVLYVHAIIFTSWTLLFITQTALIWMRNVTS